MTDRDAAFTAWKERAREVDILQAATERGAVLKRAGRYFVGPCPACGGKDRFSVNQAKQLFNCRGAGGGDVIRLVEHIEGVSFLQAVELLTGEPPPSGKSKPLSPAEKAAQEERRRKSEWDRKRREQLAADAEANTLGAAARIWDSCFPIRDTVAAAYLESRGFVFDAADYPAVFRYHDCLPYPGKGKMPCLVCRVDDVLGSFTGIWRVYLAADGSGKADVPAAKLGLGPCGGGAVRIGGAATRIGVAEGVESALGAWFLTGRKFPVWAALSTSGMTGIELPLQIGHVTIFSDGDRPIKRKGSEYVVSTPAGRRAAQVLKARLIGEGRECGIAQEPPPSTDYADMWLAKMGDAA